MSLAVNAVVTGLILFRIFKVYWEVEPVLYEKFSNVTGGCKFRSIALALIESAMALFALQLTLFVCAILATEPSGVVAYLTIGVHQMLLGIAPTIIQVRVSMGLSFHDEGTMVFSAATGPVASGSVASTGSVCLDDADSTQAASVEMRRIVDEEPESGCNAID